MAQTQPYSRLKDHSLHYRKANLKDKDGNQIHPYEPLRKNKNSWSFANPINANPSKEIWEIGERYYAPFEEAAETKDTSKLPKRKPSNPAALVKLFYWLYLTGARQQEAFKKPYPTVTISGDSTGTWVEITHLNQKQKKANRKKIDFIIPIFNVWEQKMWSFITSGGTETEGQRIFMYDTWKSKSHNNISQLFNNSFKTSLIDADDPDKIVHKNEGITPHILRHVRAYDVLVNHHLAKEDVIKMFGWGSDIMIYYYADISLRLSKEQQIDRYRDAGLLTDLKITSPDKMFKSPF